MGDTLLTVLIIGAVGAFFVFRFCRRPASPPAPLVQRETSPPVPAAPLTEEERLAQEAAEVQERWDRERRAVERAHNDEMQPIQERLEKARQLVDKSGVGGAACDILRIMWHWPAWSKRDDWRVPDPIEGLDGGKTPRHKHGGLDGAWLSWTLDGEPYRLELAVSPNYTGDDGHTGDLLLSVAGGLVMHLDVSQRLGDDYDRWTMFGVSAFRAGPWMARLNELAGRLRIADRQWSRDHEKRFYGEKARNIELEQQT